MNDELGGWQGNTAFLALITMGMREFSERIIRHVVNGGALDDDAFALIKSECVTYFKNISMSGLPINQEAHIIGQAVGAFEQLIDAAIHNGRKL